MKTQAKIERELVKVRDLLKQCRDSGSDEDMLYGAQQALGWVLGQLQSPSKLAELIEDTAEVLDEMIEMQK